MIRRGMPPVRLDPAKLAKRRLDAAAANVKRSRGRAGAVQMLTFREYDCALAIAQEFGVAGKRKAL